MRKVILAAVACVASLGMAGVAASPAQAHEDDQGAGGNAYYGMGAHDFVPHWQNVYTPRGNYGYFGLGAHDFQPHAHYQSPNMYQGYSQSPWGTTVSNYSPFPFNW